MTREEAIEVYNGIINTKIKEAFEFFAPELRENESEDERIRKELIDKIDNLACSGFMPQRQKQNFITYLEKQKGLTTENNMISSKKCNKSPLTDEAFKEQLERVLRNNVLDTDIRITGDTVIGAKQKEQRSAEWSEEDEDMLNSCISSIEEAKENRYAYKETDGDTSYDYEIAWLKSLRPSWKPSKEQIGLLGKVYNLIWADPATPADIQDGLGDFIEQLRTL